MMSNILLIFLVILVVFAALKIIFAFFTGLSTLKTGGAMFTTTHRSKIKEILEAVPMHSGQVLYDLGCGDGRLLVAAAKRYKVKAIGLEINPCAYFLSKIRVGLQQGSVTIRFQDFWKIDLREADIVFCYLFPDVMERLRDKLSKELKSGAKVISCNFEIPGWKPEKIVAASHPIHNDPIYVYTNL